MVSNEQTLNLAPPQILKQGKADKEAAEKWEKERMKLLRDAEAFKRQAEVG